MKIVYFEEDFRDSSALRLGIGDWRALEKGGWIVDWAIQQMTPERQLRILRGELSAAYGAYFPVASVDHGAEAWRRALPTVDVPPFLLMPLPSHLAKECPDVVPFTCAVEVPALAELREMRPGALARRAQIVAVAAFGWTAGVARALGDPHHRDVAQDISRAVRRVVYEHMSAGGKTDAAEAEEG